MVLYLEVDNVLELDIYKTVTGSVLISGAFAIHYLIVSIGETQTG